MCGSWRAKCTSSRMLLSLQAGRSLAARSSMLRPAQLSLIKSRSGAAVPQNLPQKLPQGDPPHTCRDVQPRNDSPARRLHVSCGIGPAPIVRRTSAPPHQQPPASAHSSRSHRTVHFHDASASSLSPRRAFISRCLCRCQSPPGCSAWPSPRRERCRSRPPPPRPTSRSAWAACDPCRRCKQRG